MLDGFNSGMNSNKVPNFLNLIDVWVIFSLLNVKLPLFINI